MDKIEFSSPSSYLGNFQAYVEKVQAELEAHYGSDSGAFETVKERAEIEAPFNAARNWLVERWGEDYPCPVCENIQWSVSAARPGLNPKGYLTFNVTCSYCANTMQVVPDYAERQMPWLAGEVKADNSAGQ